MTRRADSSHLLEWGVASRPAPGERTCGDLHVVEALPGAMLVAVLDGLGHGEEAALAADRAAHALSRHKHESLASLVRRCHDALLGTRGVVMSLALFCAAGDRMSWLGVGNVEGVLLRAAQGQRPAAETLLLRGGVVGHSLPPLRASMLTAGRGDLLVLATDGVKPGFVRGVTPSDPVQRLAESILGRFGNDKDDGLVLVARYRGA